LGVDIVLSTSVTSSSWWPAIAMRAMSSNHAFAVLLDRRYPPTGGGGMPTLDRESARPDGLPFPGLGS
jgi:hypothetical protein